MDVDKPRFSAIGMSGLLFDVGGPSYAQDVQDRLHGMAAGLRGAKGLREVVPGMNNLMAEADPDVIDPGTLRDLLQDAWARAEAVGGGGRAVEVPVVYGGPDAPDVDPWAAHCGLTPEQAIARHAAGSYRVAALGAMPGFPYLAGLDPSLAMPRREVPRSVVPKGAVIIGGAQAGIMPLTLPSGWHIIGMTDVALFDPAAEDPVLLRPGDTVRFVDRAGPE